MHPPEISRDFKGLWIPREIWLSSELLPLEKMLWAEIHSLYKRDKGGCYASNSYLAEFLGVSERYIMEMIAKLKKTGLIESISFDGRQRVLRALLPREDLSSQNSEFIAGVNHSSPLGRTTVHPSHEPQFTPPIYIENKAKSKDRDTVRSDEKKAQTATPLRKKSQNICFNFEKAVFEGITQDHEKLWLEAHPGINVKAELAKAIVWLIGNPSKARKKQWEKFLGNWMNSAGDKAQNREIRKAAYGNQNETVKQDIKRQQLERYRATNGEFGSTNTIDFSKDD